MSKKIIGLLVAWACEDWIKPAIEQAVKYCDEVIICIEPHTKEMEKFEDNTKKIAIDLWNKLYDKNIKMVESVGRSSVKHYDENFNKDTYNEYPEDSKNSEFIYVPKEKRFYSLMSNYETCHMVEKANILNGMLNSSDYLEENNWIWILDVDEYYNEFTYSKIKELINNDNNCDSIRTNEKYFYINMKHYLKTNRSRLKKIKDKSNIFWPTQKWIYSKNEVFLKDYTMYHYGLLTNPWAKLYFWKSEYPNQSIDIFNSKNLKVTWLYNIYRNYDLNDEKYWIEKNEELCKLKSPWYEDNFKPNKNGVLFKYSSTHPEFVRKFEDIEDFRLKYNFKKTKEE